MLAGVGLEKPCHYQEWRLWLQDSFLGSVGPKNNEKLAEDSISVACPLSHSCDPREATPI